MTMDRHKNKHREERPRTVLAFLWHLAEEARREGRQRRAEIWRATAYSFSRFLEGKDIGLRQVEGGLIRRYEAWLLSRGLCPNTASFYLRNLRSACNKAVKAGLCPAPRRNPFADVYTGVSGTRKRAVDGKVLTGLRTLDLTGEPELDYARHLFLFSFYTRGMAFVDMAGLRQADLKAGVLSYMRRKTGKPLSVRWEKPMQDTLEAVWRAAEAMALGGEVGGEAKGEAKGKGTASCRAGRRRGRDDSGEARRQVAGGTYLLPVLRRDDPHARSAYRNRQYAVNRSLKEIGRRLGLKEALTMYCARHSWASLARAKEVPISVISDGLGHSSERVTQIYLATLDTSAVDRANRMIINGI